MKPLFFFVLLIYNFYLTAQPETNQRPSSGKEKRIAFIQHGRLIDNSPLKDLKWKQIHPGNRSGRCTEVQGISGNKNIIYAGFASGGLWKTIDAGKTWKPLMDQQATQSVGSFSIAPSNPDILFLGTGESNTYVDALPGIGILKSTNGGESWTMTGLENTSTISRIIIHPTDPNIVYVAAGGNQWSKNEDRGVYKTIDGGRNWKKILFVNDKTGAADLIIDPADPNTLYASTWTRIRKRWSDPIPEGGDHLYKTTDGGANWKIINKGLPDNKLTGRIGLSNTAANPNVLYAFVDNQDKKRESMPGEAMILTGAEVYKSIDKGDEWKLMSIHDAFMESFTGTQGWGYGQIRVNPKEENKIYLLGQDLVMSADAGKTWKTMTKSPKGVISNVHNNHHALWIDPNDPNYLINGNDGGVNVSTDGGATWKDFYHEIPAAQFYSITYDTRAPYNIYGSVQGQGTLRLNSTVTYNAMDRTSGKMELLPGGEGTRLAIDQKNPDLIYSSKNDGHILKTDLKRLGKKNASVSIDPPTGNLGEQPRIAWLAAASISPQDGTTLYQGFQYVLKTTDQGKTWQQISPDLSQNNKEKIGVLPYRVNYQAITAVTESMRKKGLIYAGTDDGKVHFTTAEGNDKWTDISKGLMANAAVSSIECSKYEDGTVYVTMNDRREDNLTSMIYKSTDYGMTWNNIATNLPASPVNVVREDPVVKDVLYVGTDMGIYTTQDSAKSWISLQANLPVSVSVQDLFIHPVTKQLVIATYGRGLWIMNKPNL